MTGDGLTGAIDTITLVASFTVAVAAGIRLSLT